MGNEDDTKRANEGLKLLKLCQLPGVTNVTLLEIKRHQHMVVEIYWRGQWQSYGSGSLEGALDFALENLTREATP